MKNKLTRAGDIIRQIAGLTKDFECAACGKDGTEPNPECAEHALSTWESDDAIETLHLLINEAREIVSLEARTVKTADIERIP